MPANIIKSFAQKSKKSQAEVEKLWNKAKEQADKQGKSDDYAYITGILKKMLLIESVLISPEKLARFTKQNNKRK